MNEQQANDAIRNHPTRVIARDAQGGVYAEGVAFSYSIVPVVGIRTDDGREFTWRHDMTELAPTEHQRMIDEEEDWA